MAKSKTEMEVNIGANIKDLVKAIEEAKKLISSLSDSFKQGLKLAVDVKNIKSEIRDVKNEIKSELIAKPFKVNVEVDSNKLKSNIKTALREAIREINTQGINSKLKLPTAPKMKVTVDTSSARTSIRNLKNMLQKNEVRINTGKAEGDIIRLSTYMNQLASKKVTPQIDTSKAEQAKLSIAELATYMNQLQSKKIKIDISFSNKDIVNNLKDIDSLLKSIQKNSNIKLNVNATGRASGGGGVQSQLQQYRTLRQEARHFALEAEKAWTAGNKQGFEQNRQNFLVAMKDLADFSRQLGNLSASKEAGMYSNILRSLQQTSPLYNDILNKIKQLKQEQKDFNNLINEGNKKLKLGGGGLRQNGSKQILPGFAQGTVGASAYAIHYLGRSSKGFGSFGEATAQLISDLDSMGGAMHKAMLPIAALAGTVAVTVTAFTAAIKGIEVFGGLLKQIGKEVYNALKPGIDLYKQQTSAFFSFTASLMSNGIIGGQKLSEMPSGMATAMGLSNKLLQQAQIDAEMSAFSLQDILASLQGTLPILMSKGMTMEQAYEINKGVAAVAKMIQLTPSQILQETRDLAQGSITSRGSQVANALGVTNADLKKFEGDAEGLFKFLMERFKQYSELLQQFEDTAIGRFQQLQERWQTVARSMIDGMLPQFKGAFEELINATGQWVAKSGTYINEFGERVKYDGIASLDALTGKWKDAQGNILENFQADNKWFELAEPFKEVQEILPEIVQYLADMVDRLLDFIQKETGINDPIQLAKKIIEGIADGFELCVRILVSLITEVGNYQGVILEAINLMRGFVNILGIILTFAQLIGGALSYGISKAGILYDKLFGNESQDKLKLREDIADLKWDKTKYESGRFLSEVGNQKPIRSMDELFESLKYDSDGKLGFFSKASRKKSGSEIIEELYDLKGARPSTTVDMNKASGVPKNTEDEKARKKAIKDAQRDMKEHIKGLKEALKDHIDELKEALNENKIAFDEGFMSMKNYYEQKAQIEAEEAQARLKEAQEEREWILKTPYEHQADQLKALHTVDREIRQYTRELNKATRAQQEVARNTAKFLEAQQAVTNFMRSGNSGNSVNNKFSAGGYNYTEVSQLGEGAESLAKLAVDLVKRAKEIRNVDLDVGKLLGLFFAEVGQEGNSRNWLENKNPAGFTANSATPSNMVDWGGGRGPGEVGNYEKYTDVPYMTMLDHIVNTWLKWYQKELETGVSTAIMNAGLQGVFHEANINRTSTYDSGVEYAKQHGLYDAVKEMSSQVVNAGQEFNSTIYSGGRMLLHGLVGQGDTWDIYGIGQEEIDTLTDRAQAMLSTAAQLIREQFGSGTKLLVTSGNRGSGEHFGDAIDFDVVDSIGNSLLTDEITRNIIRKIFQSIGAGAADEIKHPEYSTGPHLHANASGKDWAELAHQDGPGWYGGVDITKSIRDASQAISVLSNTDIPNFVDSVKDLEETMAIIFKNAPELGAIINYTPNTTDTSHEAYKSMQDYLDTYLSKINENQSRVTGNLKAQLMKIMPQLIQDVKKYKTDPQMLEQIFIDFKNKTRDIITSYAKDMADYNLKVMERNAEYRGTDLLSGRYSFNELVTKYNSYMTDLSNSLGLGKYIEMLEKNYIELEAMGFTKDAFEIKEYIDNLKQRLINLQKSWIEKIGEFYDRQQNLFDATEGFTNLQREFGTREIKAYKAQAEYEAYSIMLAQVNNELNETNHKLAKSQKLVKSLAENSKEWKEEQSKINVLSADKSRLETLQLEYEYQKKINDLQRKQPEYMRDLRNAALQGLENGLVTFLTDGITEAESLKDALLDLAKTFLKEIQQVSAKWIVKSLMNKWVGQFEMPTPPSVDSTNVANAVNTGSMAVVEAIHGLQYALTGTGQYSQGLQSDFVKANLTKGLNQPYQNSFTLSALQNSQFGANGGQENKYIFDTSKYKFNSYMSNNSGLQAFDQALQTSAQSSIPNFSQGLESISTTTTTSSVEKLGTSMQTASTTIESSIQRVATYISGQLMTALTQLANGAQNAANMLSMLSGAGSGTGVKGSATGGYISGPGTSMSDSIPTMLSNGEYVIKASSVKKYGTNFLNALNEGKLSKIKSRLPHFASGGMISDVAQDSTIRGVSNFGKSMASNINNVNNFSVALVRDEKEGMRELLKSAEGQRLLLDFSKKYARFTSIL